MKHTLFLLIIFAFLSSCNSGSSEATIVENASSSHKVIVKEVLQANAYTYLRVKENDLDYWMAVTKMNAEVGNELYYNEGMQMRDFKSKDLDRFFDQILFVQEISDKPIEEKPVLNTPMTSPHGMPKPAAKKKDINIEPVSGSISIAELFENRNDYANKKVLLRGEVVKVNPGIMKLNWIHLQDGTNFNNNFDLTITTLDLPKLGDIVTFEGTVVLNKDFGAGYSYELIIQEGLLK